MSCYSVTKGSNDPIISDKQTLSLPPYPCHKQSLQKNRLIFLQGLLFGTRNAVLGLFFGILAQKSAISSARIIRDVVNGRTLTVLPFVFDAEVFAVAVVEVGGL